MKIIYIIPPTGEIWIQICRMQVGFCEYRVSAVTPFSDAFCCGIFWLGTILMYMDVLGGHRLWRIIAASQNHRLEETDKARVFTQQRFIRIHTV